MGEKKLHTRRGDSLDKISMNNYVLQVCFCNTTNILKTKYGISLNISEHRTVLHVSIHYEFLSALNEKLLLIATHTVVLLCSLSF